MIINSNLPTSGGKDIGLRVKMFQMDGGTNLELNSYDLFGNYDTEIKYILVTGITSNEVVSYPIIDVLAFFDAKENGIDTSNTNMYVINSLSSSANYGSINVNNSIFYSRPITQVYLEFQNYSFEKYYVSVFY